RRALALVAVRAGGLPWVVAMAGEELPDARHEESALPPPYDTLVTRRPLVPPARGIGIRRLARRNLVAAGSGALLAAVLGTVVTLGMTSHENADKNPAGKVDVNPSASQGTDDGSLGADPKQGSGGGGGAKATATARPTSPVTHGTTGAATPPVPTTSPSADPGGTHGTGGGHTTPTPSRSRTTKPTTPTPTKSTSSSPGSGTPSPSGSSTTPPPPTTPPATTTTASGPVKSSGSASASRSAASGSPSGPGAVL
ncbi:ATP-binding protein, partial [Streptomyces sp. NPDC004561]